MADARPALASASPVGEPSFVIVSTAYVVPPAKWGQAPYFEIVLAFDHADAAHLHEVYVSRDEALYRRALSAEGFPQRFTRRAHPVHSAVRSSKVLRQLDALEEVV